jgi:hypothetical protein
MDRSRADQPEHDMRASAANGLKEAPGAEADGDIRPFPVYVKLRRNQGDHAPGADCGRYLSHPCRTLTAEV